MPSWTPPRAALASMQGVHEPDERTTIDRAIKPLLTALGWPGTLEALSLTSRDEVDLAIFSEAEEAERLLARSERDQVLGATGIVECKRWGRDFDAAGTGAPAPNRRGESAAQQIQRYLLTAGTDSNESVRWAILTNGARWRLYSYRARPRERTWQIDLNALLVSADIFESVLSEPKLHELRVAWLLLRRDSWVPAEGERETLLDRLLALGRRNDAQLANDLSDVVFKNVYPDIVKLFWSKQPEARAEAVARAALTFLYRLLFIYYAEDRGLLDTEDPRYRPHSLRYSVRDPVHEQHGKADFSTVSTEFWQRLQYLRAVIDQGDASIGQPAYNGGLFAPIYAIVDEITLSDAELAPIIRDLSHTSSGTYVSYRNLEVQQLGSVYERLLEQIPRRDDDNQVDVTTSPYARKDSGSYYTPQELVDLIVEQTLTPLVEERIEAFRADPIEANDPAEAVLKLTVLDPAMGSGHFLITAIDWLTERLFALVDREWDEAPHGYVSPLREQLWRLQETYPDLSDLTLLQRMVLKRCIYGVDKNPMAVELAKVALWLHTFSGELPLPYLEHRIIAGDSLLGIRGEQAREYISAWGRYPLNDSFERNNAQAIPHHLALNDTLDLTIAEIGDTRNSHRDARLLVRDQIEPLNLVAGLRWLSAGMKKRERAEFHAPLAEVLAGHPARAVAILRIGENDEGLTPTTPEYRVIRDAANEVAARERILHWEIEFPHVMTGDNPGFDAIISNPPWDRIKLQEVEWWAARDEAVAKARTAADRKRVVARRRAAGDPTVAAFDTAAEQATQLSTLVRKGGDYPLLGKGDINLYSLFVERSLALVKPAGIVGLLTPSGIYADHTAADFFRSISTTGRLGGIYDFENRRSSNAEARTAKWFADVHPQFKFCALIAGGTKRHFVNARCGFYLHGQADLEDDDRVFLLAPEDFARINPNTGTAPILRTRRDTEIVSRIYRDHPALVDRSTGEELKVWPVRYHRMFDMTNDSNLFETAEALEAAGAYRVVGNRYKRGDDMWAPLYQGRMIEAFDHRAHSVRYNPENLNRPYLSERVTDSQHLDPSFHPLVATWIDAASVERAMPQEHGWTTGFRDITSATNERTMIATIVPWAGFTNKVPILLADSGEGGAGASCLVANLNSLALDYVAKRKVHGTTMNWFLVEQLPMIAPDDYDRPFGDTTARDLVKDHVLRLCYTAWDLQPFARDLGYEGDPFIWNPTERRQLRARLDALFFHLYGLDEADAAYILDQFPVLEKNERREHDKYLTKELVLGHYRALAAGDTTSDIAEHP